MQHLFRPRQLAIVLAMALLVGCSSTEVPTDGSLPEASGHGQETQLRFDVEQNVVIGTVRHQPSAETRYAEGSDAPLPIEYDGGMLTIGYEAAVEGASDQIGFLVFWDGAPVAYDVGEGTDARYCHTFTQAEDKEKIDFLIRFVPTGKAGETHTVTFASIYAPGYAPDMIDRSGYGAYHNMLSCSRQVYLAVDPEGAAPACETAAAIQEVTVTQEELTHRSIEEELATFYGCEELTMEKLDEMVRFVELIDEKAVFDNYGATGDTVDVDLCVCGTDAKEYAVTLYIDHEPAFEARTLTVRKGMVTRLSATVDVAEIGDAATIYFIAIPLDEDGYAEKTSSILLYQK